MKQLVVKTRLKIDQDELHFRRYKIFISVKDMGVIIKKKNFQIVHQMDELPTGVNSFRIVKFSEHFLNSFVVGNFYLCSCLFFSI